MKKNTNFTKAIVILLLASILSNSYFIYYALQPNTELFTTSERDGRLYAHPGRDEFLGYGTRTAVFSRDMFHPGGTFLKEYANQPSFILNTMVPLVLFGTLLKATNLNFMYVFSIISLTFIKLLILFIIFQNINLGRHKEHTTSNYKFSLLASLCIVMNPKIFLMPFLSIYGFIKYDLFSYAFLKTIAIGLPNYTYSFRFYHGLLSSTVFFLSIYFIYKLYNHNLCYKRIILYSIILGISFYTYLFLWVIIGGILASLTLIKFLLNERGKLKMLISSGIYFLIGLPMILHILSIKAGSETARFALKYGLDKGNITYSAYYIGFALLFLLVVGITHERKFNLNVLKNQIIRTWNMPYGVVILVGFVVSLILMNINLLLPFPVPHGHFGVFADYLLASLFFMQIISLPELKDFIVPTFKKILTISLFSLILLTLLNNVLIGIYHPIPPFDEDRQELYDYMKDNHINNKTILLIDTEERHLLGLYTANFVVLGDTHEDPISMEEQVQRLGFIMKVLNLNETMVATDLTQDNRRGLQSLHTNIYDGAYMRRNPVTKTYVRSMSPEELQEQMDLLHSGREFEYDYVLVGPREREYGHTGVLYETDEIKHALIFKNEKFELYEKIQ